MDRNRLLRNIKRECGFRYSPLNYSDEDLIEIIVDKTLPIFEQYIKAYIKLPVEKIDGKLIVDPSNLTTRYCKIYDLKPQDYYYDLLDDVIGNNGLTNNQNYQAGGSDLTDIMTTGTLDSYFHVEPIIQFVPPNTITIDGIANSSLPNKAEYLFYVAQPENLSQIPRQAERIFTELCIATIKEAIFNELQGASNVITPNGQLTLPSQNWESAKDDVAALMEELNEMRFEYEFFIHKM